MTLLESIRIICAGLGHLLEVDSRKARLDNTILLAIFSERRGGLDGISRPPGNIYGHVTCLKGLPHPSRLPFFFDATGANCGPQE